MMMVQQPFWLEILSTENFLGFDCKILRRSKGSLGHAACVRASAATWPSARMRFCELLLICTTAKHPSPYQCIPPSSKGTSVQSTCNQGVSARVSWCSTQWKEYERIMKNLDPSCDASICFLNFQNSLQTSLSPRQCPLDSTTDPQQVWGLVQCVRFLATGCFGLCVL